MALFTTKYFYGGKPLKEYCDENSLSYNSARNIIVKLKTRNPHLAAEDIVALAIKSIKKGRTQYYYKGQSLAKYCKERGIDNTCVRKKICKLKELEEYKRLSEEEITTIAINEVAEGNNVKYFYDGMSLFAYCIKNAINYGSIIARINGYKKSNPNSKLNDDEIVKQIISKWLPNNTTYYVLYRDKSEPLKEYCRKNGLWFSSVCRHLPTQYVNHRGKITNIPIEEIEAAVKSIGNPDGTLYYYKGETLKKFCLQNGISYHAIVTKILKLKKHNIEFSIEEIVKAYIEKRDGSKRLQDKKDLKLNRTNASFARNYCLKYNINFDRVKQLISLGYDYYTAINFIYYCSDVENNNQRSITNSKICEIEKLKDKDEKSLDDLLLLQGLGFDGMEIDIIKSVEGLIVNLLSKYKINKRLFPEYKDYLECGVLDALNKDFTLNPAQFIAYIEKSLKGKLLHLLYQNNISLQESANHYTNTVDKAESVEDAYVYKEKIDKLSEALLCLSPEELEFITRRFGFYGNELTIEEIKKDYYPTIELEELKKVEEAILLKLRNSESLLKLN